MNHKKELLWSLWVHPKLPTLDLKPFLNFAGPWPLRCLGDKDFSGLGIWRRWGTFRVPSKGS